MARMPTKEKDKVMLKRISFLFCLIGLVILPNVANAKVNIFACEPEWGALAGEIGGDLVNITVATTARQDVHHIRAKPSLLADMRKADLVFCSGASLESGWLPILLKKAGGPDVQQETIGWLMATDYVEKIGVMDHADRSMGHVHPEGNPHVHLDPRNILVIAEMLAERLYLIDRQNLESYENNLERFKLQWASLISSWESQAQELKGGKVVVYHNAWAYLLKWLGMDIVATLEPKPGIPPTASHLEKVLQSLKGQDVLGILVAPYEDEDPAKWLSSKTGIPVLSLPFTVGGSNTANSLSAVFEETIGKLKDRK